MTRRQIAAARAVCHACPVARDCLAEAIEDGETEFGIWGGYTAPERLRAIARYDPAPLVRHALHGQLVPDPEHVPSGRNAVAGVLRAFDEGRLAAEVIRL